jgi:DNA-damage-inducible protein D
MNNDSILVGIDQEALIGSPFDSIRRFDEQGKEFWLGRELMGLLGYKTWRRFEEAIDRAKSTCRLNEELETSHIAHLPGLTKGKDGNTGSNYRLSRKACYWIAMTGDTRKPEIALAHQYFAVKTRQAELTPVSLIDSLIAGLQLTKQIQEQQAAQQAEIERLKAVQQLEAQRVDELKQLTQQHDSEIDRIFNPNGHYYSVMGYARNRGVPINITEAAAIGRKCSKHCKENNIKAAQLNDPRFGSVGSYPEDVIALFWH